MVTEATQQQDIVNQAVSEGGAYEIIRKRLEDYGSQLATKVNQLNSQRIDEFGKSDMQVVGRVRIRTENNCIPRDIVRVGKILIFAYNVFIGLKTETRISDVFSLHSLRKSDDGFEITTEAIEHSFLTEEAFVADFNELYNYYKHAHLLTLRVQNQKLLAIFQIGEQLSDIRVFRWAIMQQGEINYIDNRGERDAMLPPAYDFEWQETSRNDHVTGKYPHVSILDEVFVETIGGHLTIKVENNTEDGFGIYQEPVDDSYQSLADARIFYAQLGNVIILKILPYREKKWRYLVYNTRTQQVHRIDLLQQACLQLPEDHGLIFPGGYYLQNGEYKNFGEEANNLVFLHQIRSPNGEDILYIFYEPVEGKVGLFSYNMIQKTLQKPIYGHGFCTFDDGLALIFRSEDDKPTRVHPIQVWQTPFLSDEYNANTATNNSFLGRIGNAELVRGISDLFSIIKMIQGQSASVAVYETLIDTCQRILDMYHWINAKECGHLDEDVIHIAQTAELVLDEFEKVETIRQQANTALEDAKYQQREVLRDIKSASWHTPQEFVEALHKVRKQRGHLTTVKALRYMDVVQIDELDTQLDKEQQRLAKETVNFLSQEHALQTYIEKIQRLQTQIPTLDTVIKLDPLLEELDEIGFGLDLLTELLGSLQVDDTTQRTTIIEAISVVYSQLNQTRAQLKNQRKSLASDEAIAEFSAQFSLFSQSITNALGIVDSPEKCDEQLSRLAIQLEELESRFSEYDDFLADILTKREELYDTFEGRKQALLDERQRRVQNLGNAGERILSGILKRIGKFTEQDEINAYFASDTMILKAKELAQQLQALGDNVRADELESKIKSAQQQAIRALRDKQDIFEEGGEVIKLGQHRFSVSVQDLDLTIIPKAEQLAIHLTGTDYFEMIDHKELNALKDYWNLQRVSETEQVYRAEYLAMLVLQAAIQQQENLTIDQLHTACNEEQGLYQIVRKFATPRYQEGYDKGVHDQDAALILQALLPLYQQAHVLRFYPQARAMAMLFWGYYKDKKQQEIWHKKAQSSRKLYHSLTYSEALKPLILELHTAMQDFFVAQDFAVAEHDIVLAGEYLVHELGADYLQFSVTDTALKLLEKVRKHWDKMGHRLEYEQLLETLDGHIFSKWQLSEAWFKGYIVFYQEHTLARFIPEAIAILLTETQLLRKETSITLETEVEGLLGDHKRIQDTKIVIVIDSFFLRLTEHITVVVPAYQRLQQLRQMLAQEYKTQLRLEEFKPRPLSSFVRNRLINEVYLPLIGDNLAKQMGTVGAEKRTDLMGMLLLISPPGYGKTTLMEYLASRLGLIFMKINCPSLGHEVQSVDPLQAPNATARKELEKLNLALEMGNNVMLYLDDIQHTHAEFLQKFISLSDGTRRIEGVWKGKTKTYDLRGKKFCIIMAGNPYTESGDVFKIPDMLANRADIYNLGDVFSGKEEVFASSYIENCLTSNSVLAPLAIRDMEDVYKFMRMAKGEAIPLTDLNYSYSAAEAGEIETVLKKLLVVQDIVLKVNQEYIASAAQADKYRTEPPFKLQGSYRNMNKMAEKIVAVMNAKELQQMIADHYLGEAQTLTSGAEENLLKLAELRGVMTEEEKQRWEAIKAEFRRVQSVGGDDADGVTKMANQVSQVIVELKALQQGVNRFEMEPLLQHLQMMQDSIESLQWNVKVENTPVPELSQVLDSMVKTIEVSLMPLISAMQHKLTLDHDIWERLRELTNTIKALQEQH